jgi:hypothetical protein
MVNLQLLKYIQDSLANNVSLEQIRKNLSGAGWPDSQIDEAVNSLNQQVPKDKPIISKKQAPTGIKVLAVLGYIGVALNVISGLFLILAGGLISTILSSVPALSSLSQLSVIAGISVLIFDVFDFFLIRGLWKGQKWARTLTIIFGILGILSILGVILLAGSDYYIYGGISLVISLIITLYLMLSKKVKEFFK